MKDFSGKLAAITGGGTGMGRELARQLIAEGCDIAICDISQQNMAETVALCEAEAPQGTSVSSFACDVADETRVLAWREYIAQTHETEVLHLLFNNAGGTVGGNSMVVDEREDWDRTFAICWGGVYYCTRAFLPMMVASDGAHLVNTSSVNGFWASIGEMAHTPYSAAKFAVKGFTEALITDMRINAPHVKVSVVMPGHIGTSIMINSSEISGRNPPLEMTDEELQPAIERLKGMGLPVEQLSMDDLRQYLHQRSIDFRDNAPTTAAEAATIILDGVRENRWRILVGEDAHNIDQMCRERPEEAYTNEFLEELREKNGWDIDGGVMDDGWEQS